ncbi:MAG: DUF1501 domain-containing protein [Pseudomonadota bacterium]
MNIKHTTDMARRAFLRRSAALGITGAIAPWAMQLSMLGEAAAAQASGDDYKALVCIFLNGGNDYANTLIPYDSAHYGQYAGIRAGIARSQESLAATALPPSSPMADGLQLALAPEMAALMPVWNNGHLAVQLNVGPLIVPTTLAQYKARSVPLPPKLFSHNDQVSIWQSGLGEGATQGWGGRMGDLLMSSNGNSVFTCISAGGNAVFLAGDTVAQYQISTSGAIAINGINKTLFGSAVCQNALRTLITQPSAELFANEYARVTQRSIDAQAMVSTGLAGVTLQTQFNTQNSLAMQLKVVAQLIAARASLGAKRQVFLVSLGGFDLHDNLLANHPTLLGRVAEAMRAFYDATLELGVASQVTAFTASDFGRTLSSNGDGSDHGWGSHHLVMGGAVQGQRYYGLAPTIAVNGPDDVGQGRLLPTTSVDQYAATFATWMGISPSALPLVMPNIGHFAPTSLGFV